jgi:hypothetical protein
VPVRPELLRIPIYIDDVSSKQYKQVYIIRVLAERMAAIGEMARTLDGDRSKQYAAVTWKWITNDTETTKYPGIQTTNMHLVKM